MVAEKRAADLDASLASSQAEVASLKSALSQTMASMSAVQAELEATKVGTRNAYSYVLDQISLKTHAHALSCSSHGP